MAVKHINHKKTGFFRFKKIGDDYLLTNDAGDYEYLSAPVFEDILSGKLDSSSDYYESLKDKGFIRCDCGISPKIIEKYASKNTALGLGTSLHIIVVTLRCDFACVYCHASKGNMWAKEMDMSVDTARLVVDRIFESPHPSPTIEFQGGEPLLNFDTVKFIVEYAKEKNKTAKKNLLISIVTNLSSMNDEILDYLCRHKISLCTSIDGPENVHNQNRKALCHKNGYQHTVEWFKQVKKKYFRRVIYRPNALTTITKCSLPYYKEIVDEYVNLGVEGIHLRPLNPFGLARKTWEQIGYTAEEFISFYINAMDYILEINRKGKFFYERGARVFLTKIMSDVDPNYFETRSPCGAGIGQLAYNYNGDVYTCDEGRMVSRMGDEAFKIGNVKDNVHKDFIKNEVVKSVCIASLLEILPGCADCVYKPYCGVCPIYNYVEDGNIFGQMPNNDRCKINMAVLNYIFDKIRDKKIEKIFEKWVTQNRRINIA